MAYDNLKFCWNGIVTSDVAAAGQFYSETIGWTPAEHTFPDGSTAAMLVGGGLPRAHLRPTMPGEPSHWESYLRVQDVDQATQASADAGGAVLAPPTDIAPGRCSVVASPSGGKLCLYHEADEAAATNPPPGIGGIVWTELHSRDVEPDVAWLKQAFGFGTGDMPIPGGGTYTLLEVDGVRSGGACAAMHHPDAPSMWLNWAAVNGVDEVVERIKTLGGKALTDPSDYPGVGRMAIVADPEGAIFGVITPAAA